MNPEITQKLHQLKLKLQERNTDSRNHTANNWVPSREDIQTIQSTIDIIDLFANMGRVAK